MPSKQVTIAFVNQPVKNPNYGSIKTKDGEYYSVKKALLDKFVKGQSYVIDYAVKDNGYMDCLGVQEQASHNTPGASPAGMNGRSDNQAADIFVTGVVGRAMGSGKFEIADITSLAIAADDAYAAMLERRNMIKAQN